MCMLAARAQAIARLKESPAHAHLDETALLGKLMAYCSRESHSSVEKDAMICFVKLRILEPDEKSVLRGETLRQVRLDIFITSYMSVPEVHSRPHKLIKINIIHTFIYSFDIKN